MDDDIAVKNATVSRFRAVANEYGKNDIEIKRLQERQAELSSLARKCHETAHLFGFDLLVELAARAETSPQMFTDAEAPVSALPPAPRGQTIREIILEIAKQAYPNAVRAADLRQELLQRGIQTHEKTVGMTLYRIARDEKAMRREGKADWFFVPEDQRIEKTPSSELGVP